MHKMNKYESLKYTAHILYVYLSIQRLLSQDCSLTK